MTFQDDPRARKTITFASATSLSPLLDLAGYRIAALDMSSGWDAANRMTFQASPDAATATSPTWHDLYDSSGAELQIASGAPFTSTTGRALYIDDTPLGRSLASHRYVRFRSGPAATPANLSTGVTITAMLLPVR